MQSYQVLSSCVCQWCAKSAQTQREGTRGEKSRFSKRLVPHPHNFPSNLSGVLKIVFALIFLGFGLSGACAEEKVKAPEFVPIVVDQAQYQAVMGYLGGLKYSDAAPVVKWLSELEDRAKGQWEADHNKPAEVAK